MSLAGGTAFAEGEAKWLWWQELGHRGVSGGAQAGLPDGGSLSLCVSGPGEGSDIAAAAAARLATHGLRKGKRHRDRLEREGNKGRLRISGSFISFLLSLTSSLQSLDAPNSHRFLMLC